MSGASKRGVILAAGRGNRMGTLTEDKPKCLIPLGGQPLLDWQLAALHGGGVDNIVAVTGYRGELLSNRGVSTIENSEWSTTNMIVSLLCAGSFIDGPTIISYADIVYDAEVVRKLLATPGDLVIAYDICWLDLWSRRFFDPLSDAESFRINEENIVIEIGRKATSVSDIQGQYIGLLKITPRVMVWINDFVTRFPKKRNTLEVTHILQYLIESNFSIIGMPIEGGWCEIDSPTDLSIATALLDEGKIQFSCHSKTSIG